MNDIISHIIGLSVAEIVITPLNTIKIIYQTTDTNFLQIIDIIYQEHGILGFYNSLLFATMFKIFTAGLKYFIYNEFKKNKRIPNMMNGILTGIMCPFITQPFDIILNHIQRFIKIDRQILKLQILYTGLYYTLLKNVILCSLLYPLFDYMKLKTNNNLVVSCFASSFVTSVIIQPIDYLKNCSISQIQFKPSYYRGFHLNYTIHFLHFTISMLLMNKIKKLLEKYKKIFRMNL